MTDIFRIPKLAETANGTVTVVHWGQAGGLLFRAGDHLILNEDRPDGLLVLCPRGWGNPMLGRHNQGELVAEPSGAPASPLRWEVAGSVSAIERDLERGGIDSGRWWTAIRVECSDIAVMANARGMFESGWMNSTEVDEVCRRAAIAPELAGVSVAVAAADSQALAESLLENTRTGRLRFQLRSILPLEGATGVVFEGPWKRYRDTGRHWAENDTHVARVAQPRRMAASGGSRVQLSLFGDIASADG